MKAKKNFSKKSVSSFDEGNNRNGLRPVKSKAGKSKNRLSIYDELDEDFDEDLSFNNYPDEFDDDFINEDYEDDDDY